MPPAANSDNAKLGPKSSSPDSADYVTFHYNPSGISISHTAPMQPKASKPQPQSGSGGAEGGGTGTPTTNAALTSMDEVAKANGVTTITVRALTFDGGNVAEICKRLLSWTHLTQVSGSGSTQTQDLPELMFIWGTAQTYLVNLNQVTINYTRFSRTGLPVRATVDLTLHSIPRIPGPTNPSSGGLSGRRTHLLVGAETLPTLATRTYGEPGRWREIAAANRIEDPLRVRPGTLVYLPSTQEGAR